jgi:hypothetical protein
MLDLHAGVHLDEVELAGVDVLKELDGPRAFVGHGTGQADGQFADLLALLLRKVGGGARAPRPSGCGADRAVALPQVIDVALLVAEDLNLDVAGAEDHLLEVAFAVAKGGLGLAPASSTLASSSPRRGSAASPTAASPGRPLA